MAYKVLQYVILLGLASVTTVFLGVQRPKLPQRLLVDILRILVVVVGHLGLDALLAVFGLAAVL